MAHLKITVVRRWYGKVPVDKLGKPIPKNLWPKRRRYNWEVRWYGSDGTRYSKSFGSRMEAQSYAEHHQLAVNAGIADKPQRITLEKFIEEHSRLMTGRVALATLRGQLRVLNMFAEHIGKDSILDRIRPQHAESFMVQRFKDVEVATANKDLRTLKGVFNTAIELRGYLMKGTNPFAKLKQQRYTAEPNRYVSMADLKKLLDHCRTLWWRTFLSLIYVTGCRRDEALNLTWNDVDLRARTIKISPKKPTDTILQWEPKDHESRTIPISRKIVKLLNHMKAATKEGNPYVFIPQDRLAYILTRRSAGQWVPDGEVINNILTVLRSICKKAEVPYCTLHDLRRSCITNWAKKSSMQVVRQLAGHSNLETTCKYYLSVQQSDIEAIRAIQDKCLP